MSDQLDRQGINARQTREGTIGQLGQFLIVAARQIVTNLAQGFGDDVVVVQQPFRIAVDRLATARGGGDVLVSAVEGAADAEETAQQGMPGRRARSQSGGAGAGVQMVEAKQFAAQRFVGGEVGGWLEGRGWRGRLYRGGAHRASVPVSDVSGALRRRGRSEARNLRIFEPASCTRTVEAWANG